MITFDPNLRPPLWKSREEAREQILWGLSRADVVKISDDEVEFLWGITDETEAAGKLLNEYGVRLAMITPVSYTHLDVYKRQKKLWPMSKLQPIVWA